MKLLLSWLGVLWLCLTAEVARPDLFPPQSLTVPLAVAGMTWLRSASGLLVGGSVLLIRWLLQTPVPPFDVALAVAATAWQIHRTAATSVRRHEGRTQETVITALIVLLTVVTARLSARSATTRQEWLQVIGISCAVLLVSRAVFAVGDACGLRRRPL